MKTPITTQQAMSHPDVVATINCLSEMADRLRAENEELNECRKRLYGFMLDCNAVGLEQASKNLHRGLKEKTP